MTVYVVLLEGEAETGEPVVELRPAAGDHEYETVEPEAVNTNAGEPIHNIEADEVALTVGFGFTVTVAATEEAVDGPELQVTSQ